MPSKKSIFNGSTLGGVALTKKKKVEIAQLWQHYRGNYTTPTIYQNKNNLCVAKQFLWIFPKKHRSTTQCVCFFLNNVCTEANATDYPNQRTSQKPFFFFFSRLTQREVHRYHLLCFVLMHMTTHTHKNVAFLFYGRCVLLLLLLCPQRGHSSSSVQFPFILFYFHLLFFQRVPAR